MMIGVAAGILGKKLLHNDIITVVGALIALVGMFLTVYRYLAPSAPKKFDSGNSQPEVLIPSKPTNALPDVSVEYLSSITEQTTQLLKNSVADKSDYAPTGEAEANPEKREKP